MKVKQVSELHRQAMEYTDESFIARGLNERDEYLRLTRLAFEKESAAADLLANEDVEPSRAILHRSAATLAYRCEKYEEAKRLIHRALAGSPPMDIEAELEELLGKVILALADIYGSPASVLILDMTPHGVESAEIAIPQISE